MRQSNPVKLLATISAILTAGLLVLVRLVSVTGAVGADQQSETLRRGQRIYEANCAICHGQDGNGRGMAAHMLVTQPRDFRTGLYKFRSTPSGALPTDDDLMKIITNGIRWTSMVGRGDLTESDRGAVIQYLKTFSPRFKSETVAAAIAVAARPPPNPRLVAQGRRIYRDADCAQCHGERADGKGASRAELLDERGWPLPASDLTWRPLKRGAALDDLYLTIATGLSGTPMPAYAAALNGEQIWALVYYLESLVPDAHKPPPTQRLGEESRGWMILGMHGGMMGRGIMR